MKRKIYLQMRSREEAQSLYPSLLGQRRTPQETISTRSAIGRVTAAPVIARFSAPSFHAAAMDGIAVVAADTFGASDETPCTLRLDTGQAEMINTGYPMPEGKDAVIMIENVVLSEDGSTGTIRESSYPWQYVRKVGEDIVATELLYPTGHRITPADMAAMLTAGCASVTVYAKPKVTIMPTGSELIDLDPSMDAPPPGKTIESNSAALSGLAEQAGAEVTITPILSDQFETIQQQLLAAVESDADVVIINAGSSAGSADYTAKIIEELGTVHVHGVTIMPGKPSILGMIHDKPVIGLPGYPVSAIISMEQFVVPLLSRLQGIHQQQPETIDAVLAKSLPSRAGIEEFRRMITGKIGPHFITVPLKKGSGTITTLTRANSMLRIASASEGEQQGKTVQVELLTPRSRIEQTLICTGSHDLSLDILHDFLQKRDPAYPLASTHVGSLGGIMALKQGLCHMAGSHLLNPDDGSYNLSYIKRYLSDRNIRVITLVHREQGFIVPKGNPKNIGSIHDLFSEHITFINRQAGSGTRVLFDYALKKNNLDGDDILGYDSEEYTHMAVSVSVLSGKADVGLGIKSAARALGLDFVPLAEERYDLLIPEECIELPMIQAVLETISTDAFTTAVENMGGYSTRDTGKQVSQE
ncbi:molybdopterin biosynthesis protein [Desulfogranum japonicum]|uniref:molybdopterin biosynthesis protein n=1 Tax=Desulfogranum japonicum TaxID=231447 RepID=UPI0004257A56|nr:molybdopterin biosynthesis protein [Desulfogranum japonicum]